MHSSNEALLISLKRNHRTIHDEIKNITHAESLVQPPYNVNCLNWVLGHIISARDNSLRLLRLPAQLSEAERLVYGHGSQPLTDPQTATDFDALVEKLDRSFEQLEQAIAALSDEDLGTDTTFFGPPKTLYYWLAFFLWEEAYHTGQLDLLRQMSGKNDKII
jgi:uncharacterized damage-inducible protein DinB